MVIDVLQTLKDISSYTVPFMLIVSFISFFIKPIRKKFIDFVKTVNGTNARDIEISNIKKTHEDELFKLSKGINEKLDSLIKSNESIKNDLDKSKKVNILTLRNIIDNIYDRYAESEMIPSYELDNLIEAFALYKDYDQNGKTERRYKVLMKKKEIVPKYNS